MFCKFCGSEINDKDSACPSCGKIENSDPHKAPAHKKLPLWIKLLFLIAGLGIVITSISVVANDNAEEVVSEQLKSIRSNQLTQAYYGYTSKEFQATTTLEQFKEFLRPLLPFMTEGKATSNESELGEGIKLVRETFTLPNKKVLTIDYHLLKEEDLWKIINIKLVTADYNESGVVESQSINPVIEMLEGLKSGHQDQVYQDLLSKEFKATISQKAFQELIKSLPLFETYSSYDILSLTPSKQAMQVVAFLRKGDQNATVNFTMSAEDQLWKIGGIIISGVNSEPKSAPFFNSEDLMNVASNQLEAIKKNEIEKAYKDFTTLSFREATPLSDFQKFINTYKVFSQNKSAYFYKLSFNNNIAILNAELSSTSGEKREVEYYLAREDNAWKILQIHILEKGHESLTNHSSTTVGA